ncbi:MAG: hypothetical protein SFZ03_00250 [Candidatus Melainabacteria bacterium]|nr:hypothetical protein [Candidatus Melainabacteria bacterium]
MTQAFLDPAGGRGLLSLILQDVFGNPNVNQPVAPEADPLVTQLLSAGIPPEAIEAVISPAMGAVNVNEPPVGEGLQPSVFSTAMAGPPADEETGASNSGEPPGLARARSRSQGRGRGLNRSSGEDSSANETQHPRDRNQMLRVMRSILRLQADQPGLFAASTPGGAQAEERGDAQAQLLQAVGSIATDG